MSGGQAPSNKKSQIYLEKDSTCNLIECEEREKEEHIQWKKIHLCSGLSQNKILMLPPSSQFLMDEWGVRPLQI